jgi:hypothetical protein
MKMLAKGDEMITVAALEKNEVRGRSLKREPRLGSGGGPATVVRIQLDFPQDKVDELNLLMEKSGITTRKDLFNNALSLLAWAIKEREDGNIIAAINEAADTYKELVMHPLETAARKKPKDRAPAIPQKSQGRRVKG